ncbi:MAG TPA: prepilin-type N-terminal cleavage/methylation domain-containing protein, partial [Candidatus Limnocylindria bacterium]|nr:prepilin-type N-terminal cleavage/methylation domain-containing protein [Candidatus Limnocylindria bacterium]
MARELKKHQKGFSLVEVLLAMFIFGLLATALVGAVMYGQESAVLAGQQAR